MWRPEPSVEGGLLGSWPLSALRMVTFKFIKLLGSSWITRGPPLLLMTVSLPSCESQCKVEIKSRPSLEHLSMKWSFCPDGMK